MDSHKAWEQLFHVSQDSILLVDSNGEVVRLNPSAVKLFGDLSNITQCCADPDAFHASLARAVDGDHCKMELEFNLKEQALVAKTAFSRVDTTGASLVQLVIFTQRTDRELEVAYDQFEFLVNRRTEQLQKANQELRDELVQRIRAEEALRRSESELKESQVQLVHSEKMASLGQLTAGISHEINNPIAFISGNLDVFARYIKQVSRAINAYRGFVDRVKSEEQLEEDREDLDFTLQDLTEIVGECRDGIKRINEIIYSLRSFARLDPSQLEEADVNEGIRATLRLLSPEIRSRCQIVTRFGDVATIQCYPGQLNQVFLNLIVNAVHAVEKGGEVVIATEQTADHVEVSVKDNGHGISDDQIDRVFQPFYTTKSKEQGTGLGLSISKQIIDKHQGSIDVSSRVGEGTAFRVKVPLRQISSGK